MKTLQQLAELAEKSNRTQSGIAYHEFKQACAEGNILTIAKQQEALVKAFNNFIKAVETTVVMGEKMVLGMQIEEAKAALALVDSKE